MPTYYELHREHCLAMAKAYRDSHREQIAKRQAEYYQKVNKARRALGRKLYNIEFPKPPKPPKPEPRLKTTKTFLAKEPVPKVPRVKKVFPDLSTVRDFTPVASPGLVMKQPGVFLDWHNL